MSEAKPYGPYSAREGDCLVYDEQGSLYRCSEPSRADALARRLNRAHNKALAQRDGWVSVGERLPGWNEWVLVHIPNNAPRTVMFTRDGFQTCAGKVTHWQPLPPAPKGSE